VESDGAVQFGLEQQKSNINQLKATIGQMRKVCGAGVSGVSFERLRMRLGNGFAADVTVRKAHELQELNGGA
jgi:hypothetical protein